MLFRSHKVLNNPRVLKELSSDYVYPLSIEKVRKDIRNALNGWRTGKAYVFTVFVDGNIAGQAFLEEPDETKKRYTIGFYVGKEYWNKGITSEAVKQIVKFGFDKLKLHKIVGDHDGCNPASGRVMEKAGFEKVGVFKKHAFRQGKWQDVIHYGLIRRK